MLATCSACPTCHHASAVHERSQCTVKNITLTHAQNALQLQVRQWVGGTPELSVRFRAEGRVFLTVDGFRDAIDKGLNCTKWHRQHRLLIHLLDDLNTNKGQAQYSRHVTNGLRSSARHTCMRAP